MAAHRLLVALLGALILAAAPALRLVAGSLGVAERGETLARAAEETFAAVDGLLPRVPPAARPRVYLARGGEGLETGSRGSINTAIIERAGGVNVVEGLREKGGLVTAAPEQVIAWALDTVVTLDRGFRRELAGKPAWQAVPAVGAAHQSLFRNPLVSRDILCVSTGAGLGAVLGIPPGLPVAAIQLLGFGGDRRVSIPKLRATDPLEPFGSCRICLVEIEGRRGTPASCTMPAENRMKVRTQTDRLARIRRGIMELHISVHPLDCLTCPANGDCEPSAASACPAPPGCRPARPRPCPRRR